MVDSPTAISPGPNDELFLHPSDHPNFVLSTSPLSGRNYSSWHRSVEVSLLAKNKLGFVTSKQARPADESPLLAQWERCNNMVISWILHSVEKEIAESILFYRSAALIWQDLGMRFGKSNRVRIYQLQKDLSSATQGNLSFPAYFTKMKKLWDEYAMMLEDGVCTCGSGMVLQKFLLNQQIIQLLDGLNDEFAGARSHILMTTPPPNLAEIHSILLQDEEQRELSARSVPTLSLPDVASAMAAPKSSTGKTFGRGRGVGYGSGGNSGTGRGSLYCDNCKIGGHTLQTCWKIHGHTIFCDFCKGGSHVAEKCWKRIGYPPGKGPRTAATASSSDTGSSGSMTSPSAFTVEQMSQLMALLKTSNNQPNDNVAFMAGPYDEESSCDWP